MTKIDDMTLPLTSLLPVANSRQQLVAFSFDLDTHTFDDSVALITHFQESGYLDKLESISFIINVANPLQLPADLADKIPPQKIILNILEASVTELSHGHLTQLASQGFRILFDQDSGPAPSIWPELPAMSHDMAKTMSVQMNARIKALRNGRHWAKNVANMPQLLDAIELGFKLYSGDYAYDPVPSHKVSDGGARVRLLKLLGLVSRDADSHDLEELFKQDATLSFMLFKLVSTAAFSRTVKVTSFGQAINLLGRRQLQRWLQLLLYARQQESTGALNPLMLRAAFRACVMEAIAKRNGADKEHLDCAYMVGMFSLLDKLFGCPLDEILQPLNLVADVTAALMQREGKLGFQLRLVELADRGGAAIDLAQLNDLGLTPESYYACLFEAYTWVDEVCREL